MDVKKNKTNTSITLPQVVDAYQVGALKDALAEAVGRTKPIKLKFKKVERIDTLGCQVLLAAHQSAVKQDVEFELVDVSEACEKVFKRLGADKVFANVDAGSEEDS